MTIRPATLEDIEAASELLYLSGPAMFGYFFASEPPLTLEFIRLLYQKPDVLFSYKNALVDVQDGRIGGLILGARSGEMAAMEKNLMKYGQEMMKKAGLWRGLKMMFHSGLGKVLFSGPERDDDYYISNLAVLPDRQGQGLGRKLLEAAQVQAQSLGCTSLSLLVETPNLRAKGLYDSFGFKTTNEIILPKKYHKHHLYGAYKMQLVF